jgi:hypothetical protein
MAVGRRNGGVLPAVSFKETQAGRERFRDGRVLCEATVVGTLPLVRLRPGFALFPKTYRDAELAPIIRKAINGKRGSFLHDLSSDAFLQ